MNVEFIASVAVITPDPAAGRRLFIDTLGLPLSSNGDDEYVWTDKLDGARHFGVWPLSQAAQSCFGTDQWPADRTVPQMSIEFEQRSIEALHELEVEQTRSRLIRNDLQEIVVFQSKGFLNPPPV